MADEDFKPGLIEQRLGALGAELIAELERQLASEEYEQTVLIADADGRELARCCRRLSKRGQLCSSGHSWRTRYSAAATMAGSVSSPMN